MGKIFNTPLDMWRTHQLMQDIKNSPSHQAFLYQKKYNNPYKHAISGYFPPQPKTNIFKKTNSKVKNFFENVKFKLQFYI